MGGPMHRAISTVLAAAGLALMAFASASAAPVAPPPYTSWAGLYLGGLLGGAWGRSNANSSTFEPAGGEFNPVVVGQFNAAGAQTIKPSGFIGGLDAGYNWQAGNYLLGLEGDIEWLDFNGAASSGTIPFFGGGGAFSITSNVDVHWLATLRARLGYTAGNWLFYATGGAAFTTLHGNFDFFETHDNIAETASVSSSRVGYTVGGGVETYLSRQWSVKAEYLFVDFGHASTSGILAVPIPTYSFSHTLNLDLNIARVGLNYHF
jgi:outer membrane immunogenic protein